MSNTDLAQAENVHESAARVGVDAWQRATLGILGSGGGESVVSQAPRIIATRFFWPSSDSASLVLRSMRSWTKLEAMGKIRHQTTQGAILHLGFLSVGDPNKTQSFP